MLQATRLNAARAAVKATIATAKAAEAKAAATAGDTDAAAEAAAEAADNAAASASLQGLTAGMQGLGLKGLAVNPHALDALQADILPDWEQDVCWGEGSAPLAPGVLLPVGSGMGLGSLQLLQQPLSQAMQPLMSGAQQPLLQGSMLPLGVSMQPSVALPGMASALPGLPPVGQGSVLPPAHTGLPGLPGAFSTALPGGSMALPGGSLPGSGLPGSSMLSQGTPAQDVLGHFPGMGSQPGGMQDAAAMGATSIPDAAMLAATPMGLEGVAEQAKGSKAKKGKGLRMGKPKKPLEAALADLKLHRHMLRLMPSIAAAAAAQAAAEAAEAAAAAAVAAAASGDRAAAAALPTGWVGSAAAAARAASAAAAEAEEQLKLRHVGELLQLDMKPVLPDDDDWLNDIVWDAQEAAAAAAAGAAANGALRHQQLARSVSSLAAGLDGVGLGDQQALVVRQQGGAGAAGRGGVLWDLNDPYMVFEAPSTHEYANARAMMHPVPAQVRALRFAEGLLFGCWRKPWVMLRAACRGQNLPSARHALLNAFQLFFHHHILTIGLHCPCIFAGRHSCPTSLAEREGPSPASTGTPAHLTGLPVSSQRAHSRACHDHRFVGLNTKSAWACALYAGFGTCHVQVPGLGLGRCYVSEPVPAPSSPGIVIVIHGCAY